jgi:hypothetical protein
MFFINIPSGRTRFKFSHIGEHDFIV